MLIENKAGEAGGGDFCCSLLWLTGGRTRGSRLGTTAVHSKLGCQTGLNGWGVLEVSLESWGGGGWEFLFGNFLCFYHDVGPLPMEYYIPSENNSKR